MNRALITGISGQDGAYLAQLLVAQGCDVYGTSRDCNSNKFERLSALGLNNVKLITMEPTNRESVRAIVEAVRPNVIFNLSCMSSVGQSFINPNEAHESIVLPTNHFLETIVDHNSDIRFFNPASSEMFGDTPVPATESTVFNPKSPYAEAKVQAFQLTSEYRQTHGIYACSAIMFNHDSPLRPQNYVTRKIVAGAIAVATGQVKTLHLGNLSGIRDWGWAPEYVDAMWRMMAQDQAGDFIIATGHSFPLEQFVETAFECVGFDWKHHVIIDPSLFRDADIIESRGCPKKALEVLGWHAKLTMPDIARRMVDALQPLTNK